MVLDKIYKMAHSRVRRTGGGQGWPSTKKPRHSWCGDRTKRQIHDRSKHARTTSVETREIAGPRHAPQCAARTSDHCLSHAAKKHELPAENFKNFLSPRGAEDSSG